MCPPAFCSLPAPRGATSPAHGASHPTHPPTHPYTTHASPRYEILRTCVAELAQAGIVLDAAPLLPYPDACALEEAEASGAEGPGGSCSMEEETEAVQARYLR